MKAQPPRNKVTIIGGAGTVGSTLAFHLGIRNITDEIVLIDVNSRLLTAHVMDIEQAIAPLSTTRIRVGTYDDLVGTTTTVVACSMPDTGRNDRSAHLQENLALITAAANRIKALSPATIVITVTNPVDVLNYFMWKETGFERARCLGFTMNDSLRFRWAIANVMNISPADIHALVIGEHGRCQVPLFSTISVRGDRLFVSDEQRSKISNMTRGWFDHYISLESGRTSGWTSAVGAARLVEQVLVGADEVVATSVVPAGEYGLQGLSIGLPVRVGRDGASRIERLLLTDVEAEELQRASEAIKRALTASNR